MRDEQLRIARVEPLRVAKINLAALPISSLPHDPRHQPRHLAVVWKKWTRPLEVMFRRAIIIQTIVMILSQGQKRFPKVWLERERGFRRLARLFASGCGRRQCAPVPP